MDEARPLREALAAAGFGCVCVPMGVRVALPFAWPPAQIDVLLLTSPAAVRALGPSAGLSPARVAVVGETTAVTAVSLGWSPTHIGSSDGAQLVDDLGTLHGQVVVWPRAQDAAPGTADALRRAGAVVDERIVYRNDAPSDLHARLSAAAPWSAAVLLAPSAVRRFAAHPAAHAAPVVAWGPTTAQAATDAGLWLGATCERPAADALPDAVRRALAAQRA